MAKVIKFNLSGKTAFFKKPDVNSYLYFTYNSIHKVALLGLLGAIMGFKGYNQQNEEKTDFPEFYEKLKDLKISIVPKNEKGYVSKKVQKFNNSVGYASREQGGNLIVKEQWLEDPKWDIYILLEDNEVSKELERRLKNFDYEFIPYLGKNDHFANLTRGEVLEASLANIEDIENIESYFPKEIASLDLEAGCWKSEEVLPYALEKEANQYEFRNMVASDFEVEEVNDSSSLYEVEDKILWFG